MLFFWRKNKEIDRFANTLADELYSQLPPSMLTEEGKSSDKKLARRFDKELQSIVYRLQEFRTSRKLGVYGKARFHLIFMERLREHEYPEDMIKELNDFLLVKVP